MLACSRPDKVKWVGGINAHHSFPRFLSCAERTRLCLLHASALVGHRKLMRTGIGRHKTNPVNAAGFAVAKSIDSPGRSAGRPRFADDFRIDKWISRGRILNF